MFKKILVPVNLEQTHLSKKALDAAISICQTDGAQLQMITVVPGFGMPMVASYFPKDATKEAIREVKKQLKTYLQSVIPDGLKAEAVVAEGNPSERIVKHARKNDIDLIIMPCRIKKLEKWLLGSCSSRVVEHANCSVMVIKGV